VVPGGDGRPRATLRGRSGRAVTTPGAVDGSRGAGPTRRHADRPLEADVIRTTDDDLRLLRAAVERALALGRGVAGTTGANPAVGCVLLRDGTIVGEGATSPVGGPHAEVLALRAAGTAAHGATAIVTLEPCAHTGRTPPCTDALLAAGVTRVLHLVADPNPVAAGGAARLRDAGREAELLAAAFPELADLAVRAAHDLRGFLTAVATGRPHVLLKLAQRRDGRTVSDVPDERYLTGAEARHRVHELRADVDAVLVGSATVRADDPGLDVRGMDVRRQPRPVVLATCADVPPEAAVVRRGAIVIVGAHAPTDRVSALEAAGAEVHRVATVADEAGQRLDLVAALGVLPDLGVLTVLAEPGRSLAASLIAQGLVDVVELHVAAADPTSEVTPALVLAADRFEVIDLLPVGADLAVRARVVA
jgi:diaminohydroxyphosphoribosylaminopyrimidine deaminase / 5-amino-6-(5-phosphoribosylamino)uracil reductase